LFAAALFAIPALAALAAWREADSVLLRPRPSASPGVLAVPRNRSWQFLTDGGLLPFAVSAVLFRLDN
jgi:hypothetical protein